MDDKYSINNNSGLDEDGFMKIPELITELPFLENKDKEPTPWYKDMLGNYVLTFSFGHYKMQNVQWESGPFVWNELNWLLLDIDNSKGQVLLLAENCVAQDFFYGEGSLSIDDGKSAWEKSEVRAFLNGKFFEEAFDEETKKLIIPRNKYKDKIFILNKKEIEEKFKYEDLREGKIYYADDISGRTEVWLEPTSWWIDTEGEEDDHMCVMTADGHIDTYGREIDADETGIRPAMWVDLVELIKYEKCKNGTAFAKLIEK